jgi:hypothetical protein
MYTQTIDRNISVTFEKYNFSSGIYGGNFVITFICSVGEMFTWLGAQRDGRAV